MVVVPLFIAPMTRNVGSRSEPIGTPSPFTTSSLAAIGNTGTLAGHGPSSPRSRSPSCEGRDAYHRADGGRGRCGTEPAGDDALRALWAAARPRRVRDVSPERARGAEGARGAHRGRGPG